VSARTHTVSDGGVYTKVPGTKATVFNECCLMLFHRLCQQFAPGDCKVTFARVGPIN
jgi:hypothetical protein